MEPNIAGDTIPRFIFKNQIWRKRLRVILIGKEPVPSMLPSNMQILMGTTVIHKHIFIGGTWWPSRAVLVVKVPFQTQRTYYIYIGITDCQPFTCVLFRGGYMPDLRKLRYPS